MELNTEGECGGVTLKKCLYIPGMRINFFSGQKAREGEWSYMCSGKVGGIITVNNISRKQVYTLQETSSGRKTLIYTPVRHQRYIEGQAVVATVDINILHTTLGMKMKECSKPLCERIL